MVKDMCSHLFTYGIVETRSPCLDDAMPLLRREGLYLVWYHQAGHLRLVYLLCSVCNFLLLLLFY